MGSVGRNRSWTKEIHHMDTLFLQKQRFQDNLKHCAHARHLPLHLGTTADECSQVSWFFWLCLPSLLLNMNNRWGCDLPKYFFVQKTQRIAGIIEVSATFAAVRLLQLSSTSVYPHLASILWSFTYETQKQKQKHCQELCSYDHFSTVLTSTQVFRTSTNKSFAFY